MANQVKPAERVLQALQERAKELQCLYAVEEILNAGGETIELLGRVCDVIPPGWQYSDYCFARIIYDGNIVTSSNHEPTDWVLTAPILMQDADVGSVEVYYTRQLPNADEGPFLNEEIRLIRTIADRIGQYLLHQYMKSVIEGYGDARREMGRSGEWKVVLDLLRKTDQDLFLRIARKMMNHLVWNGVVEADEILSRLGPMDHRQENRPRERVSALNMEKLSDEIFEVADQNIYDEELLALVQKWMQEDRANFLVRSLINLDSSLTDISDAVRRFHHLQLDSVDLPESTRKGVKVALVRRFLSDQLDFIKIAKEYVDITDFVDLIPRLVHPVNSHGKIGGKSAGLFLAKRMALAAAEEEPELKELLGSIRTPKTWYITSDGLHAFLQFNNLEDITEQKYKPVEQVRQEHPHIIHLFKNSHFPAEIIQGISMALDDFEDVPLIVRSSSLLEDRLGSAFSGKYASLFVANRGTKRQRLEALLDAIAEVYSSTFGSDPIEYRAERGLLDFHEEMGILIQEVVGAQVDNYFLPSWAGVAFSNNEFRWSPRIKREDGLIRLVGGLGTRAVDRVSDDYPILVAPGQPNLSVNVTTDETIRYSPRYLDVINLDTNEFETVEANEFLAEHGDRIPGIERMVSLIREDTLRIPNKFELDLESDDAVITFRGLIEKTPFVQQVKALLDILADKLNTPVDIEFASDGEHFHLLQCRPQSHSRDAVPTPIPKDIPDQAIVFSANRYVSNGTVPDITHIVYVDPARYGELESRERMHAVARAVGQLNAILPKRQFILMGPGRWGSRGDIKLGVPITYSDINNTAVLIEVARQKGNYVPDLSFGTHFFQDLVEASIRYLPLYPDDENVIFNEDFLTGGKNMLSELAPEYEHLEDVVHVIDVPRRVQGKVLRVYMNADLDEAIGVLSTPSGKRPTSSFRRRGASLMVEGTTDEHWRWRQRMVERLARQIDTKKFGIKAFYVFGSTKNGTAGPGSDIDVLLHVEDKSVATGELSTWLKGWSQALDEINFLRTGYHAGGLLDVHFVDDDDVRNRTSYAAKIGAVTDAAREVPLGGSGD